MKSLIHSAVQPLKFGISEIISPHTLQGMWWFIHDGIKIDPY